MDTTVVETDPTLGANRGGDGFKDTDTDTPTTNVGRPDKAPHRSRTEQRFARRAMRLSGKVPQGLQSRWKFLKNKGHPAAAQYGMVAKAYREYNRKQKEESAGVVHAPVSGPTPAEHAAAIEALGGPAG